MLKPHSEFPLQLPSACVSLYRRAMLTSRQRLLFSLCVMAPQEPSGSKCVECGGAFSVSDSAASVELRCIEPTCPTKPSAIAAIAVAAVLFLCCIIAFWKRAALKKKFEAARRQWGRGQGATSAAAVELHKLSQQVLIEGDMLASPSPPPEAGNDAAAQGATEQQEENRESSQVAYAPPEIDAAAPSSSAVAEV